MATEACLRLLWPWRRPLHDFQLAWRRQMSCWPLSGPTVENTINTLGCTQASQGGTMAIAFPGESREYRLARDRLLEQEIELRRAMEAVAAARRRLPPGGVVPEDYVFHGEGPGGGPANVRLSDLFVPGRDSLVIYSMMFPRDLDD